MGALDVCPFIPVRGVTEEECIQCSKRSVGHTIPVHVQLPAVTSVTHQSIKSPPPPPTPPTPLNGYKFN